MKDENNVIEMKTEIVTEYYDNEPKEDTYV
jgi:hypothetical protein